MNTWARGLRFLVLALVLLVLVASGIYIFVVLPGNRPASYGEMRRYLVGRMSDDQIRKVRDAAIAAYEREQQRAKNEAASFWKGKAEDLKRCRDDIAFRTRNPDRCAPLPLGYEMIGHPIRGYRTVDEAFETLLMGVCAHARTVRQAKEWKCLP